MPQLYKDKIFVADLLRAKSLKQRLLGLIPHKSWPEKKAFWIPHCNSVHTFFMKFPLDILFASARASSGSRRAFKVLKIFENVPTHRLVFGGFKRAHVFEFKAGQITQLKIKPGEHLHVES